MPVVEDADHCNGRAHLSLNETWASETFVTASSGVPARQDDGLLGGVRPRGIWCIDDTQYASVARSSVPGFVPSGRLDAR
jgi:hypothetical protein